MIDKLTIYHLKPLHGAFNTGIFFLLVLQGLLGLKIRTHRKAGASQAIDAVRKHRSLGPVVAFCASLGFCAGAALAYLDHGQIMKYPRHFFVGLSIVSLLVTTALVSKRITAKTAVLRNLHFGLGVVILILYAVQIFLGLRMIL